MTDERFLRGFRAFDAAVAPDPAFAERLFGELARNLGFESGGAAVAPPIGTRLRRSLRLDWRPFPPATMRLVYLAATLALLLVALAATAFVASQLRTRPSPADLVHASRAAYEDPPAFSMTFSDTHGGRNVLISDGDGNWRVETASEAPGSYYLYDGKLSAHWNAELESWGAGPMTERDGPVWPFFTEFTWSTLDTTTDPPGRGRVACADPAWLDEAKVAGREADHIVCRDIDMQFWLDRETHLVLRILAGPAAPGWEAIGDAGAIRGMEAISLAVGPVDDAAFSWLPKPGATGEDRLRPSSVLRRGDPVPLWRGTTISGATVDTASVSLPAAFLFWSPAYGAGHRETFDAFVAAVAGQPAVSGILVGEERPEPVAGFVDLHPTTLPVVMDTDGAIATTWGIEWMDAPIVVLVGRDGAVAAVDYGRLSRDRLDLLLGAMVGGEPVPSHQPVAVDQPSRHGTATDTVPPWNGTLLGGGTLASASLLGRPTVVVFADASAAGEPPTGAMVAFVEAEPALRKRANVVVILPPEFMPEGFTLASFSALLDDAGIDDPVVLDWDRAVTDTILDAYCLSGGPLVLDADGRLVANWEEGFPGKTAILAALDTADATGAGSPAPSDAGCASPAP